jgi:hypothetical protein
MLSINLQNSYCDKRDTTLAVLNLLLVNTVLMVKVMVLNATFNTISVISCRSVLESYPFLYIPSTKNMSIHILLSYGDPFVYYTKIPPKTHIGQCWTRVMLKYSIIIEEC